MKILHNIDFNRTTFLLGSGISEPSKLPNVNKITKAVFKKGRLRESDQARSEVPLDHVLHPTPYELWECATVSFLTILKSHCDQHLAIKGLPSSNYEDMYYLGKQIVDFKNGNYDNPALLSFLTELDEKSKKLENNLNDEFGLKPPFEKKENTPTESLAERCLRQIEETVARKLKTPAKKDIKGLQIFDQVLELRKSNRLNIVTLNHDLLLETYLEGYGTTDGFSPYSKDLHIFSPDSFFDPKNNRVTILKPHGSINWFIYKGEHGKDIYCRCSGDPNHVTDSNGDDLRPPTSRLLLAGTTNKEISYGSGVFLEVLFQLHALLKRTETLIVSGYSFRDKGINNRIWAWLDSCEENKVLILHKNKKELLKKAKYSLISNFERYEESKKIRFIEKWMCCTKIEEVIAALK